MQFKLCSILHIFGSIATIQAAIKDFIIEDENDLERFGLHHTEIYDDEYDLSNAWPFDNGVGGGGGSCDVIDAYDSHDNYAAEYEDLKNGEIDANFLRAVLQQIKNDPRFKHLRDHLHLENFVLEHERHDDAKKLQHHYIDVNDGINMYEV